ncbi:MAG TPA: ATP-dependent zinc metalloprotease FtsH [Polyangiales bacterium]|nr:ATP-dependent zinc metalloprotease FtsH [Polyangiales bacterium]
MPEAQPRKVPWPTLLFFVGFVGLTIVQTYFVQQGAPKKLPYSELVDLIEQNKVGEVEVDEDAVIATLREEKPAVTKEEKEKPPQRVIATRIPGLDPGKLVALIESHGVKVRGRIERTPWWESFLIGWVLPIGLMFAVWSYLGRRASRRGGPLSFGRSRVKVYDRAATEHVTFEDVAGVDEAEAELVEVVDYLKNPAKYKAIGARIPKGVLLLGPPGTGKTLLAKAVAGEAEVAFFSMSGSDFVEMFVGVGAARIRDLFEQAKQRAPCIVFIDELDAIGKSRGGIAAMGSNDEREQTLNQLLVEMDGFDAANVGVVIMAATNRPEVLDQALIRAGRFDRQVLVDRPDVGGRTEILKVHSRKVMLDKTVDLEVIAQRTPGMTGADLANLVNEAALSAARRNGKIIEGRDFEEATDRIQLGLKKKGRIMRPEEKRRVAYHESGHTLIALSVPNADPVHRVTIIPRSIGALGVTLQLPTEERYLMTKDELLDRICVMLGGRAAEEIVQGNLSTGAQNDLERATETARQMVCRFGMSEKLGPLTYGKQSNSRFLDTPFGGEERNFSDETGRVIDQEVRELIETQYARALSLLREKKVALETIAERLLKVETLERTELEAIANA